jgi:ATP-binding cassette subfamily B protein
VIGRIVLPAQPGALPLPRLSTPQLGSRSLSNLQLIKRLLGLTWSYRYRCLLVFGYQLLLLSLGLLGLSFTGLAIDAVREVIVPGAPAPRWPFGWLPPPGVDAESMVLLLGLCVLAMAALRAALNYTYAIGVARLVQMEVVPALRSRVYEKLQRLSFRFFDQHASGGLINRVTGDVQSLRSFIDGVLIQGGIMLLSLGVYVAYMLTKSIGLTCATLLATPLLWWFTARFSRRVQPAYAENRAALDRMVLEFSEGVEGIQIAKVFAREAEQYQRFTDKTRAVFEGQRSIFRDVSRFVALIDGIGQLNLVVLLVYGAWLVAGQRLTLGDLVVFAGLLQQYSAQVSRAATIVNTLQQSLAGARRVYEVLDAPSEIESPSEPSRVPASGGSIELERVVFGYDRARPVLHEIDLEVAAGGCVALVGETGAGKSTLLSLVPRFYDASSGRVSIDGVDVRSLDLDGMRRRIGVVFQSNLLFRDTLAANIAFGHRDATRAQIERAARVARAHDFIMRLPQGYETRVEQGASNLSGGEKQRIALARALLLEPSILLLDDPTSGIDAETERELIQALAEAIRGRTTLIATHRISLARTADLIVVLSQGRIVERGTHAELMARGGVYRRTAELQGFVRSDAAQARLVEAGA